MLLTGFMVDVGASLVTSKAAKQNVEQVTTTVAGSTVSGNNVAVTSGRDTLVKGSTIVADADIDLHAGRNLSIVSAQESAAEKAASASKVSGFVGSFWQPAIGAVKQSQDGVSASVTQAGSQIASLGAYGTGNVSLKAGEQYAQTASDVIAAKGDIGISGKNVVIGEAYGTGNAEERTSYSKTAIGGTVSVPLLSAVQGIKSMADAVQDTGDSRIQALAAINAGMNAKAAVDSAQALASGNMGGIKVSVSLGSTKSESSSQQEASTVAGSSVSAGGNVNIEATGAGKDSNLNAIAANISASNNVTLKADNQVNLIAVQSTLSEHSDNKSSGASIGIGFAIGGGQNGFTLEASASKARGNTDGSDVINVNTHVIAGKTATIQSGGDTGLKGAVVAGNTVKADIGGNLNIESLQDSSRFDSKQTSSGIGVSLCIPPFCYGTSSVSGSAGKTNVHADYLGVVEQSGIKAGDGGFAVTVKGNTDLKGAVIASTQTAVDENKNKLVAASLTQSDLQNRDVFDAKGYSVSATVSSKLGDQGAASTPADKTAASDTTNPSRPGASAGVGNMNGSQGSVTASGISGGTITLTDEAKQKELTGQDGVTAIAKAQTGVTIDKDTADVLTKAWDGKTLLDGVNAQVAVTQAFSQTAPRLVGDYAQGKLKEAADLRILAAKETDLSKRDALQQAATALEDNWKEGGTARVALHTAAGALGGGTGGAVGSAATALSTAAIAEQINNLEVPKEVKDALTMIAGTVAGGVTGGVSGAAGGLTQITNNYLNHKQLETLRDKLAGCKQRQCSEVERQGILNEYRVISEGNDAALAACTTRECIDGHVKAIEQAKSIAAKVLDDIDGAAGFELRGRQVKTEAINNQYKKVDVATKAAEELRQWARNHCEGISQQQCAAKLSEQKAFVADLIKDFTPIVGDIKAFAEAQGAGDYLLATIGMVGGPIGDALGAVKKATKAAEAADVGKSVATAEKGVDDAVSASKGAIPPVTTSTKPGMVRPDLDDHLINVGLTKDGRQISGGHNADNFNTAVKDAGGKINSKTELAPGIVEVKYELPGGREATKTIYDPKIYPDIKMAEMANNAANKALIQFQSNGNTMQTVVIEGIQFRVPIQIRNSVPYIPTAFPIGVAK